jgi:hypothetical protein
MDPQQLLEEYWSLQMMVMYNGDRADSSTAVGADAAGAGGDDVGEGPAGRDQSSSKKKGGMDAALEEFLVQQVRQLSGGRMMVLTVAGQRLMHKAYDRVCEESALHAFN